MANTLKFGNENWATKKDTILAYNDENANFKPLPFTTSRASTATRVNKAGLLETVASGIPRVDYLGNTKGAYLLEPRSTNLVLNSSEGDYGNSPASTLNTISPDGTLNAFRPIPNDLADRYQYNISSNTYATNTKLTYSWYRKRLEVPFNSSYVGDLNIANLINTTQVGLTNQIQSDVNGFDRFQAVLNITDGSVTALVRGYFGYIIGLGNSSIAYFGHQLEQGSYATSYIPTAGSAITRLSDDAPNYLNLNPLNIGNSYTLFLDAELNNVAINKVFGSISNSASVLSFTFRITLGQLRLYNNLNALYPVGNLPSSTNKWAIRIDGNSYRIFGADSSLFGVLPTARNFGQIQFYGTATELKINNFNIYNTALSDAECQALVN